MLDEEKRVCYQSIISQPDVVHEPTWELGQSQYMPQTKNCNTEFSLPRLKYWRLWMSVRQSVAPLSLVCNWLHCLQISCMDPKRGEMGEETSQGNVLKILEATKKWLGRFIQVCKPLEAKWFYEDWRSKQWYHSDRLDRSDSNICWRLEAEKRLTSLPRGLHWEGWPHQISDHGLQAQD